MTMPCKPRCGKFIVLVLLGVAALSALVMALWNWLMPALFFGAREITYLQAVGVLVLSKILFGGFRGHGGHGRWHQQRWEQMTPEERAKLQAGMRHWCGGRKSETATPGESKPD
ncbi:MAG TPA: hypothetical protein VFF82_07740 [Rhodocyclaceae bacterium]|nr:hypothetical protein [Rhodocyclaceae bacterium]